VGNYRLLCRLLTSTRELTALFIVERSANGTTDDPACDGAHDRAGNRIYPGMLGDQTAGDPAGYGANSSSGLLSRAGRSAAGNRT
jgi:hypothetical protein